MGNRWGRRKTLAVKKKLAKEAIRYSSTLIPCQSREGLQISRDVCVVGQVRHPNRCKGCKHCTGEVA